MKGAEKWVLGVIDVETTPIRPGTRPRTRFWGIATELDGYRRFETSREVVSFMQSEKIRLYHHHDFDVNQLIVDGHVPSDIHLRGSRVIRSKVGQCELYNSFALFPSKLATILAACGFAKLPMTCDAHKPPENSKYVLDWFDSCSHCREALAARNKSDCVAGLASLIRLGEEYASVTGIDPIRQGYVTAASSAFAAAELQAGPLPIDLRLRESYRGGRTEAFRVRDCGEAASWDINSSYPHAFTDLPDRDWLVLARVKVKIDDAPRPFFAHGPREDGLKFPAGTFETWFFGSNYERYIQPHGGVDSIKILEKYPVSMVWLKRVATLIRAVYQKRLESKDRPALDYPLKVILNSLYGKLGQRAGRQSCYRASSAVRGHTSYRLGPGEYLVFQDSYADVKANYPFAAAITDNGRARLYDALARTNPYYCDTDSVYCHPKSGMPGDVDPKRLGAWKLVKTGPLKITSVKDYEFAGETHRKGGATSDLWTIRRALAGQPIMRVDKSRKTDYDKRRVRGDGSTAPLVY